MTEATEKQINYAKSLGIENPEQFTKEELIPRIDKAKAGKETFEKEVKAPVVRPGEAPKVAESAPVAQKNTGYYVSYAKDIFCAVVNGPALKDVPKEEIMKNCIAIVKQAVEAFE